MVAPARLMFAGISSHKSEKGEWTCRCLFFDLRLSKLIDQPSPWRNVLFEPKPMNRHVHEWSDNASTHSVQCKHNRSWINGTDLGAPYLELELQKAVTRALLLEDMKFSKSSSSLARWLTSTQHVFNTSSFRTFQTCWNCQQLFSICGFIYNLLFLYILYIVEGHTA